MGVNIVKAVKKNWLLIIGIVIVLAIVFRGGSKEEPTKNKESNETKSVSSTATEVQDTDGQSAGALDLAENLEIIYEKDEQINRYINQYNAVNPENKITKELAKTYFHHGRDHDDQIKIYQGRFPNCNISRGLWKSLEGGYSTGKCLLKNL